MKARVREALMKALEEYGMYEEDFVLDLEQPRDPSHGDLTTNVALVLAKKLDRRPRELAGELAANLELDRDEIESVEIAGPGFVNFRAASRWWSQVILDVLEERDAYGRSDVGAGQRINVEFVSANPTGPLNIVSARAAAVGSSLCRALDFAGYRPHAEFYCNDAGRQMRLFGASLRARYAERRGIEGVSFPEEGYRGEYLVELADRLAESPDQTPPVEELPDVGRLHGELPRIEGSPDEWLGLEDEDESSQAFGSYALVSMVAAQRRTCHRFGLRFDTWFLESSLHRGDRLMPVLHELRQRGHVYDHEGAEWFRSTEFGDEKDRVLVKADGIPTYFLADIAYHASKHDRGGERAIDFLGPDHHGHILRLSAAMRALGYGEDWLEINILQQVNLILDGKPLDMSKRAGRLVTMDQLIDEVGADVAKFFFLARKNASHLDFDLDLAKEESSENPVYYVKYAHARICSVLRNAQAREFGYDDVTPEDLDQLQHEAERNLVRILPEFEATVAAAARSREISRLTTYAMDLAAAFHPFYHQCTILGEDPSLSRARLALCEATRVVLANAMRLIGVEAPERM